jgi:hypothetical protein
MNNLMRRAKYIFCMFLMVHAISLAGQSRSDLRSMFVSAEGDILFEDYAEALPKYLSLLQMIPDNYNLCYRVGQCYLNTPGEKDKAITWLETAVKNIDTGYRAGRLSEKEAPHDALYHLANAYRIANNFDKALETYELFLQDVDTEKYDTTLVRFQMQSCHNARKMMLNPSDVDQSNLGAPVNDRYSEFNPVVSADEKTLIFTRELPFYDAIFWSRKENGSWTEPVNMTPQLGVDQDYYTSSLSPDGMTLLMYRVDTYDGNIYMSRLQGDTWSKVEKLNGHINTKFWESHATMSIDGRKIYFTSNRRESLGGLDIFVSARDSSGNWGPAENLGPEINTLYNEETPFLANSDSTLFFSSRGHHNIGGYDIFRSDLGADGRWSTPVNAGYPLNTTDDDLFFTPLGKGNRGYFSKFTGDGEGRMDIYSCDIYSEQNPRIVKEEDAGTPSIMHGDPAKEIEEDAGTPSIMYGDPAKEMEPDAGALPMMSDQAKVITLSDSVAGPADSLTAALLMTGGHDSINHPVNDYFAETDSLELTEISVSDTGAEAEEKPADVTSGDMIPITGETPVMTDGQDTPGTAGIRAVNAPAIVTDEVPGADKKTPLTPAADTVSTPPPAEYPATDTSGDEAGNSKVSGSGKCCCLWWITALAVLLFFLLILKRRKKKKENDIEQ